MSGRPFSKQEQLSRGTRRYRRKVASPKRWQAIIDAKAGPCRICRDVATNGRFQDSMTMHHLVPRAQGGDDVPANIVALCRTCHALVTNRNPLALEVLALNLDDAEYAYIVGKLGEGGMERLFGVGR